MKVKILYLPAHAVLEYDEVRLLSSIGHALFSPGFYLDPSRPSAGVVRPGLPEIASVEGALDMWRRDDLTIDTCLDNPAFVALFDVVIIIHSLKLLAQIEQRENSPLVIYRMIGQSNSATEDLLGAIRKNAKIVRYSPAEENIRSFAGSDEVIRFGKFASDFHPYVGDIRSVLTFYQSAARRLEHCNYEFFELATRPFDRVLYGNGNPSSAFSRPAVTYEQMLELYACHTVYYSMGTYPASYTLNLMEAMLSGTPIVALGQKAARPASLNDDGMDRAYEVPQLLAGAPTEMIAESVSEARDLLGLYLRDAGAARAASEWVKARGTELFSSEVIGSQWAALIARSLG